MTQRNSSMAEQSAGVASELQQATDRLEGMVVDFRVAGGTPATGISQDVASAAVAELRQVHARMAPVAKAVPARLAPARSQGVGSAGGWEEF